VVLVSAGCLTLLLDTKFSRAYGRFISHHIPSSSPHHSVPHPVSESMQNTQR